MTVINSEFSHTAMTGLFVASSSEVMIERNVFTDIGYHGLLQLGAYDYQNITISNNYFDGSGITRSVEIFSVESFEIFSLYKILEHQRHLLSGQQERVDRQQRGDPQYGEWYHDQE